MSAASNPTLESVVAALADLRSAHPELQFLSVVDAKEVEVKNGVRGVVVFVPFRQLSSYKKIQTGLIEGLEKKFAGKHFSIVAQRTILKPIAVDNHKKQQKRPNSRTLTAVHEALLNDLVYPSEVAGKRTRVRLDGSKFLKIKLDRKDAKVESKVDTYAAIYKKITGQEAHFEVSEISA